jgi:hypothetical protein
MSDTGYPLGQPVRLTALFEDAAGLPANPDVVSLLVWDPAGISSAPVPTSNVTGTWFYDLVTTSAGNWTYEFRGTGSVDAVQTGAFYVQPAVQTVRYSYDITTDVGRLRHYIDDHDFTSVDPTTPREQRSAIFTDDEIEEFLRAESDNLYAAVGMALMTIATNRALLVQRRDLDGASVDFGSLRSDLMKAADAWTTRANRSDRDVPADGIAEVGWSPFAERRILINSLLREEP